MGVWLIPRPWDSGHLRMDKPAAGPPSLYSTPGASGLLLDAMIATAPSAGKRLLNPRLGINVAQLCQARESDDSYTLALQQFAPTADLRRTVNRASRELKVEQGRVVTRDHEELISEFLQRQTPGRRIERLFLAWRSTLPDPRRRWC